MESKSWHLSSAACGEDKDIESIVSHSASVSNMLSQHTNSASDATNAVSSTRKLLVGASLVGKRGATFHVTIPDFDLILPQHSTVHDLTAGAEFDYGCLNRST